MSENSGLTDGTTTPITPQKPVDGDVMAVAKPTLPSGITPDNFRIDNLMPVMPGDEVYFAAGSYATLTEADTAFAAIANTLSTSFISLGELSEKAGKFDSKQAKNKSRNFTFAGRRSSTAELYTVGISNPLKDYLESPQFTDTPMTMAICSADADRSRVVVLNGLRWTADYSGEVDGLFQFTLSADFTGPTARRLLVYIDGART